MKIYISHSKNIDFVNELYKPIKESELSGSHTFIFPHEGDRHIDTKEVLRDCDLVIAEVSVPATGQGIELGWANMMNIPILCVSKEGSEISRSLKYITDKFLSYKDSAELISKISEFSLKN